MISKKKMTPDEYKHAQSKHVIEYVKENYVRLEVRYFKSEYESIIAPAIEKADLTKSAFVRRAIEHEIERINQENNNESKD